METWAIVVGTASIASVITAIITYYLNRKLTPIRKHIEDKKATNPTMQVVINKKSYNINDAYDLRSLVEELPANILEGLAHENMYERASEMAYALISFAGNYSRYSLRQLAKIYERSCFYGGKSHSARRVCLDIHEYVREKKEIWEEFSHELFMSYGNMSFLHNLTSENRDQKLTLLLISMDNFANLRIHELEKFTEYLKKIKQDKANILLAEIREYLKIKKRDDRLREAARKKEEDEKQKILNPA